MKRESSSSIFALLESVGAETGEFRVRSTGIKLDAGEVQHALDGAKRPALLVPLGSAEADVENSEVRAISFRTFPMQSGAGFVRSLIVRCEDSELAAQFSLMVDDMIQALVARPSSPGAACIGVLERWRNLLEPAGSALMSAEAQIGLLAELHVLEVLLASNPASLSAWTGPDRARHDFSGPHASVEVKATTSRDQFSIAIHGDRQLEDPVDGTLFVYAEQLEADKAGESVNEAVARITSLVFEKALFLTQLSAVGFRSEDAPAYEEYRFSVLRRKLCLVGPEFPRITRQELVQPSLLDRIQHLSYSIDMGPVSPFCADELALTRTASLLASK